MLKVLCIVQCLVQPVAVLQLQDGLPFVQPVGLSLTLLRPGIAKVDGVTDQLAGGVILGWDVPELRQTAVHLQYDALLQRFCLERVQSQQQLVRVSNIHVLPGIREAHPHAVHVAPAGQLHPDSVLSDHRLEKLGLLWPGNCGGGSPQVVALAEDSPVLLLVSCAHLSHMEKGNRLWRGPLQMLQDEPPQGFVVTGSVVEVEAGKLICQLHSAVNAFWMLQCQRAGKQQALFGCHILKSSLQPVMVCFAHLHAVQQMKKSLLLLQRFIPPISRCGFSIA